MSVIDEIYRESFHPADLPHDDEYECTLDHLLETEDLLKDTMGEEQLTLLVKYQDVVHELHQIEAEAIYKAGAQFGAAIAKELHIG